MHAARNLYPGVNTHLNSLLQQRNGGWESFHATFLAAVQANLERHLPPNYYSVLERSLQITVLPPPEGEPSPQRTRPDISILQTERAVYPSAQAGVATAPTVVQSLTREEDEFTASVVIYRVEGDTLPGVPVARLELLSAANKPGHEYHRAYLARRGETLRAGVVLLEIDLLHETRPLLPTLPDYTRGEPGATPYLILVSDPAAEADGREYVYHIGLLDPLPTVALPLSDDSRVLIDFNTIYHDLFQSQRVYGILVDYDAQVVNIGAYTAEDAQNLNHLQRDLRS